MHLLSSPAGKKAVAISSVSLAIVIATQAIAKDRYRQISSNDMSKCALGSGLIDQSQKMTVAAMQMADMKVCAQRS